MALDYTDYGPGGVSLEVSAGSIDESSDVPAAAYSKSAYFNTTTILRQVSDVTTLDGVGFTVEFYFKQENNNADRYFWRKNDSAGMIFYVESDNDMIIQLNGTSASLTSSHLDEVDTWIRLTYVYKKAAGEVRILKDGVHFATASSISTSGVPNNAVLLTIAQSSSFRFKVADIRIWNTERSDADILSTKNTRLVGNETGLIHYYPLAPVATGGGKFFELF